MSLQIKYIRLRIDVNMHEVTARGVSVVCALFLADIGTPFEGVQYHSSAIKIIDSDI